MVSCLMYVTLMFLKILSKQAMAAFALSSSPSLRGTVRDIKTLI